MAMTVVVEHHPQHLVHHLSSLRSSSRVVSWWVLLAIEVKDQVDYDYTHAVHLELTEMVRLVNGHVDLVSLDDDYDYDDEVKKVEQLSL